MQPMKLAQLATSCVLLDEAKIERALGWRRTLGFERMITDMVDADLERLA